MSEILMNTYDWHKKEAIDGFNQVWDLMEKEHRSDAENNHMIHLAHASCFHWGAIGTPVNLARGEWQIARVYALVGMPESAAYHAQCSLDICLENEIAGFDLAFAYEALARACKTAQDEEGKRINLELAHAAAKAIEEAEDRAYFLSELATI